jgi:Phage anti-repressor protein
MLGFIENVDYATFDNFIKREGSNLRSKTIEYALKLNTAKEISMVENNEQREILKQTENEQREKSK